MQLPSFPPNLLSFLFPFPFNLITHHLEVQGFIFFFLQMHPLLFFSASFIMYMSTCFQNNHFIQPVQWKKKSVKSVARFPVDKTSSWLTGCFTYQLCWHYLDVAFVSFFSPFIEPTLITLVLTFLVFLLSPPTFDYLNSSIYKCILQSIYLICVLSGLAQVHRLFVLIFKVCA